MPFSKIAKSSISLHPNIQFRWIQQEHYYRNYYLEMHPYLHVQLKYLPQKMRIWKELLKGTVSRDSWPFLFCLKDSTWVPREQAKTVLQTFQFFANIFAEKKKFAKPFLPVHMWIRWSFLIKQKKCGKSHDTVLLKKDNASVVILLHFAYICLFLSNFTLKLKL